MRSLPLSALQFLRLGDAAATERANTIANASTTDDNKSSERRRRPSGDSSHSESVDGSSSSSSSSSSARSANRRDPWFPIRPRPLADLLRANRNADSDVDVNSVDRHRQAISEAVSQRFSLWKSFQGSPVSLSQFPTEDKLFVPLDARDSDPRRSERVEFLVRRGLSPRVLTVPSRPSDYIPRFPEFVPGSRQSHSPLDSTRSAPPPRPTTSAVSSQFSSGFSSSNPPTKLSPIRTSSTSTTSIASAGNEGLGPGTESALFSISAGPSESPALGGAGAQSNLSASTPLMPSTLSSSVSSSRSHSGRPNGQSVGSQLPPLIRNSGGATPRRSTMMVVPKPSADIPDFLNPSHVGSTDPPPPTERDGVGTLQRSSSTVRFAEQLATSQRPAQAAAILAPSQKPGQDSASVSGNNVSAGTPISNRRNSSQAMSIAELGGTPARSNGQLLGTDSASTSLNTPRSLRKSLSTSDLFPSIDKQDSSVDSKQRRRRRRSKGKPANTEAEVRTGTRINTAKPTATPATEEEVNAFVMHFWPSFGFPFRLVRLPDESRALYQFCTREVEIFRVSDELYVMSENMKWIPLERFCLRYGPEEAEKVSVERRSKYVFTDSSLRALRRGDPLSLA